MAEPRHSWALRILAHLPLPLAQSPERVVLNFACVAIGVSALTVSRPGSLLDLWPEWVTPVWALAMIVGGCAVLAGMFLRNTTLERLGYILVGVASLLYGVSTIASLGFQAMSTGLIFLGVAASKAVRMLVSSAARDTVLEVGERMDRDERDTE